MIERASILDVKKTLMPGGSFGFVAVLIGETGPPDNPNAGRDADTKDPVTTASKAP